MKVVFSYDCEGNWGFVDWEDVPFGEDRSEELEQTYQAIVDLHLKYEIPATFAFVGMYIMNAADRQAYIAESLSEVETLPLNIGKQGGCWEGERNLAIVKEACTTGLLEIGSHSMTHRELNTLSHEECNLEFSDSHRSIQERTGIAPKAFIFPRNLFAFESNCMSLYSSYRSVPEFSKLVRGCELFRSATGIELNRTDHVSDFVFFKGGMRRRLSGAGWRRCWEARFNKIERQNNKVIQAWSHPHNCLTDPDVLERIEWLMQNMNAHRNSISFHKLSEISPTGEVIA